MRSSEKTLRGEGSCHSSFFSHFVSTVRGRFQGTESRPERPELNSRLKIFLDKIVLGYLSLENSVFYSEHL